MQPLDLVQFRFLSQFTIFGELNWSYPTVGEGFLVPLGKKLVGVTTSPILNQFGQNFGQFWVL